MRKVIVAAALVALLSMGLLGCGGGSNQVSSQTSNSTKQTQSDSPQDLELVDVGYVIDEYGLHYAVEVCNPNDDYAVSLATVTITGRNDDGTIGFSEQNYLSYVAPDSTIYDASVCQVPDGYAGGDIEITVSAGKNSWSKSSQTIPEDLYTFQNISVSNDRYGLTAKGEVIMNEEYSPNSYSSGNTSLVCILKDANGKIVTGFQGYPNGELSVGVPAVFDIDSHFNVGDYSVAEMYANPS